MTRFNRNRRPQRELTKEEWLEEELKKVKKDLNEKKHYMKPRKYRNKKNKVVR